MKPSPTWIGASPGNWKHGRAFNPLAIVIHVMDGTLAGTDEWFKNSKAVVSAHYGVGKDGSVHQYVLEQDTAFHTGKTTGATWLPAQLHLNPNDFTIGIEHEGTVKDEWPPAMIEASAELIADVAKRYQIPLDRFHIVGHHEIYSGHECPGPLCPLDKLIERAAEIQKEWANASTT